MGTPAQRLESDRRAYPAMNVDEVLVWRAWLRLHQGEFDRFDYNVRIGKGEDPGPDFPENIRKMAKDLTQLRLDAVGWQAKQPTIFEVKRFAAPPNIGQLLVYDATYRRTFTNQPNPRLRLVCSAFTPNILPAIQESGILLDVVPTDVSILKPTGTPAA